MRIGFVIYGSLDTITGGYLYDKFVVRGLTRRGHNIEVISIPSGSYLKRLIQGFSPRLHDRLLTGRFDILIQDELCHPTLFWVNRRLRRRARPVLVAVVHHILSNEPRNRLLNMILAVIERLYLSSLQGFIHNSETTRQKVSELLNHQCPEVVAYPAGDRLGNPLSSESITKRAKRPGALELLFLGNVIPRKGLLPLLEALAKIDQSFWRLSIVGGLDFDSSHTARARQLAKQLGISKSVRFLGLLQNDKLIDMLKDSQLFCMPYAYEGFGIAILEAMAFGLPAIGCQDGAASETIRHGENGFLLAPDDIQGLAPILLDLYHNRDKLVHLALAASATSTESPGWQDAIEAIDDFLQELKQEHG